MSYGSDMAWAGLTRGLNTGIDQAREEARRQVQDQRAQETHDQAMQVGKQRLDEGDIKLQHARFGQKYDQAMGRFIATDGADYQGLQDLYNTEFPDGHQVTMTRGPDGNFTMDFGNGRVTKMTKEQVAGAAAYLASPEKYGEFMQKKQLLDMEMKARAANRPLTVMKSDQGGLVSIGGDNKAVPIEGTGPGTGFTFKGRDRPTIMSSDEGGLVTVTPEGVQAVPGTGPGSGFTFKNRSKRGGGQAPALLQEVDAIASRLPPQAGETEDQRWLRAAEERSRLIGKSNPAQAVQQYERALTAAFLKPDSFGNIDNLEGRKATIRSLVEDFKRRNFPELAGGKPRRGSPTADDPLGLLRGK